MPAISLQADQLEKFAGALLQAGGFTAEEAKSIAASLTLSETLGHGSHGVMRVKEYLHSLKEGAIVSGKKLRVIKETPNSLLADAQTGPGQVAMPEVLAKLTDKAAAQAVVSASVYNSGHIGRIGEWVERPAYAGFAALLMVNDNGTCFHVAAPGGKQSVTSTNPVAFAVPLPDGDIFMTDMSTSAVAFGKVKLAQLNGTALAPDCLQDSEGRMTTDPNALFAKPPGSLMPMGGTAQGYKGFALSMFVDMMTAGLSGGETPPASPNAVQKVNNLTLTLWNPKFFAGHEHMRREAKKYLDFVRGSQSIDPAKPIRLPGDRMNRLKKQREKDGVPLDDGLAKALLKLAAELKVQPPPELALAQ